MLEHEREGTDTRYEIEEYTVQVRGDRIDEYPNHRLPLLAYTATVNGSARAPYRLNVKNVVLIDPHVDYRDENCGQVWV